MLNIKGYILLLFFFYCSQGDDGDNFYVVESGVYNIYVNDGTKEVSPLVTEKQTSHDKVLKMSKLRSSLGSATAEVASASSP